MAINLNQALYYGGAALGKAIPVSRVARASTLFATSTIQASTFSYSTPTDIGLPFQRSIRVNHGLIYATLLVTHLNTLYFTGIPLVKSQASRGQDQKLRVD